MPSLLLSAVVEFVFVASEGAAAEEVEEESFFLLFLSSVLLSLALSSDLAFFFIFCL